MSTHRSGWLIAFYLVSSSIAGISVCALTGCERKEKVIDVETPAGEVEVERNIDTGKVEVDVSRESEPGAVDVDVEAPSE